MLWKIVVGILGVILVLGVALQTAYWRFDYGARQAVRAEWAARSGAAAAPPADLAGLPAPVQRYLRFAGVAGREGIRHARVEHGGWFRLAPEQPWLPMQAVEDFFATPPAFVWNARVQMAPGVSVAVRDAYLAGRGSMDARLFALFPVAQATGPEVDRSALLRWLAEAAWFPTALAGPQVTWQAVDDTHARATVRDDAGSGAVAVAALFTFAADGRITAMESDDRFRSTDTGQVRTRWLARYGDYRAFEGVQAPVSAEVAWDLPEGEYVYARVAVTRITYGAP